MAKKKVRILRPKKEVKEGYLPVPEGKPQLRWKDVQGELKARGDVPGYSSVMKDCNRIKKVVEKMKENPSTEMVMNFHELALEELRIFEENCQKAFEAYQQTDGSKPREIEFHKEVKKYRKQFNHNIQEITREEKFRLIRLMYGRPKEFQIN